MPFGDKAVVVADSAEVVGELDESESPPSLPYWAVTRGRQERSSVHRAGLNIVTDVDIFDRVVQIVDDQDECFVLLYRGSTIFLLCIRRYILCF